MACHWKWQLAYIQMLFRNLDFSTHGFRLTFHFAIRMRIVRLVVNLLIWATTGISNKNKAFLQKLWNGVTWELVNKSIKRYSISYRFSTIARSVFRTISARSQYEIASGRTVFYKKMKIFLINYIIIFRICFKFLALKCAWKNLTKEDKIYVGISKNNIII